MQNGLLALLLAGLGWPISTFNETGRLLLQLIAEEVIREWVLQLLHAFAIGLCTQH